MKITGSLVSKEDEIREGVSVSKEVDDFLEYHGVKGMRWGVRRSEGSSTETRSERRASANALTKHVWDSTKDLPIWNPPLTPEEYKRLSTKGRSYVAGTSLHRITQDPNLVS